MKTFKYLLAAVIAVCLASCGGGTKQQEEEEKSIIIKPAKTEISGAFKGCFTVVDRNYKIMEDWSKVVTIELERTDKKLPFKTKDREICSFGTWMSVANVQVGFGIEFLDKDGNIIYKKDANGGNVYSNDEAPALIGLSAGDTGSIRFSIYNDNADKIVSFRILSAYKENNASSSNSSSDSSSDEDTSDSDSDSSSDEDTSDSKPSEDWDEILDSYDSYVTKYISYLKKAADGDFNALTEYPDLLKKAQELSEKLSNAKGDLSSKQLQRYLQITNKMTNEATKMVEK